GTSSRLAFPPLHCGGADEAMEVCEARGSSKINLPRRTFLQLAAGAAALPAAPRIARPQAYPSRPVRIVVGFPPAGGADIFARLMGQWLWERLRPQFIIENRPGPPGQIATQARRPAPPP